MAEALPRENGAVSDLEGGVQLPHSDGRDPFEPFGSSFCPNWRESGAQLTEKQAVLLMHDTLSQGVKSVHALLQKKVIQQALNSEIMEKLMITMMRHLRGEQID